MDPVYITRDATEWILSTLHVVQLNMPIVSHGLSNQYFSLYKNVYVVDRHEDTYDTLHFHLSSVMKFTKALEETGRFL